MNTNSFKKITYKLFAYKSHIYKDLTLNNKQPLVCYKILINLKKQLKFSNLENGTICGPICK